MPFFFCWKCGSLWFFAGKAMASAMTMERPANRNASGFGAFGSRIVVIFRQPILALSVNNSCVRGWGFLSRQATRPARQGMEFWRGAESVMQQFEFKVIPAPRRAEKARGLKTTADRFAHTLALVMNDLARDGWEYLRADTLPCEERTGLTGKSTSYQTLLIFRRAITAKATDPVAVVPSVQIPADVPTPKLGSALASEGAAPSLGPAEAVKAD